LRITAEFVTSAAGASGFPADGLPEIGLVGRSNVGKSSLINALTRQRLARTSAAPGKTRLANVYRIARGGSSPLYLVDLPGYGSARGGRDTAREFQALTAAYFRRGQVGQVGQVGRVGQVGKNQLDPSDLRDLPDPPDLPDAAPPISAILIVDARHPGLENDREAWAWLKETVAEPAIVATKIDKLARGRRIRALRELESVLEHPVQPVSAVTGEGLDELWNLIDTLAANSRKPQPRRSRNSNSSHRPRQKAMAPRRPTLRETSGSAPSKVEGPKN
jgi:GTP-binding protein